jgi:hypothetical protein
VVLAWFRRDAKVNTLKRRTKLGDKLFNGVSLVSETLAAKIAIEP